MNKKFVYQVGNNKKVKKMKESVANFAIGSHLLQVNRLEVLSIVTSDLQYIQ